MSEETKKAAEAPEQDPAAEAGGPAEQPAP